MLTEFSSSVKTFDGFFVSVSLFVVFDNDEDVAVISFDVLSFVSTDSFDIIVFMNELPSLVSSNPSKFKNQSGSFGSSMFSNNNEGNSSRNKSVLSTVVVLSGKD